MADTVMNVPFILFPSLEQAIELQHLLLAKIIDKDINEINSLYLSSKNLGFFLLDMNDSPNGKAILKDAAALFKLGTAIFDLDLEEKQ